MANSPVTTSLGPVLDDLLLALGVLVVLLGLAVGLGVIIWLGGWL